MNNHQTVPLRPHRHVEETLVTGILNGTYPVGSALPNERTLAVRLGVTRPTLRETLQGLAKEGWLTIRHGKSTIVNEYWQKGGLSLLGTLTKHGSFLSNGFITHLLEIRMVLLPPAARLAATHNPQTILNYLGEIDSLSEEPQAYTEYDWNLQVLIARYSENPVYLLILNDFAPVFSRMAVRYFVFDKSRNASKAYYRELTNAINQGGGAVEKTVKNAIEKSIEIWQEIKGLTVDDESVNLH
jgi:GntR family negative regulator for fad regulon and positive regulator of fabA